MKIELDARLSVQDNATAHYDKAKKAKAKLEGLKKAIQATRAAILEEDRKRVEIENAAPVLKRVPREKEWFEKFNWTSVSGFLVVGGRDAKSNELVVKRRLEKGDLYFHAGVHGASSVVLKNGQAAPESVQQQAAQFSACYSSAWKNGVLAADVFAVKPEQVSKSAPSGEFLPQGSFIITGKKNVFKKVELKLVLVFEGNKIVVYPASCGVKGVVVKPLPGEEKGASSRKVLKELERVFPEAAGVIGLDDVLHALPSGGSAIVK